MRDDVVRVRPLIRPDSDSIAELRADGLDTLGVRDIDEIAEMADISEVAYSGPRA